jgi:predicted CoA-binding protein
MTTGRVRTDMSAVTDDRLREMLGAETIAVVGASSTPGKAAHGIPRYLIDHGYEVIPVNPFSEELFGRHAYDSLEAVEERVDLVDVFRPSEETGPIVDAAIDREDVETVWLQLGITNDAAGERARAAGKWFVQDRCIKVEHDRLLG